MPPAKPVRERQDLTIQNPHGEDHAAFGAWAPSEDPEVVVVTFIEKGGSGGTIAALLSRSVLETWNELYKPVSPGWPRSLPSTTVLVPSAGRKGP